MTEHKREMSDLRVGATVLLRDWQGNTVTGAAFLSPTGAWLMRTAQNVTLPILPRELIRVEHGAAEMFNRLKPGAPITLADWEGNIVKGTAQCNRAGIWEMKDAEGARWLIEPYRLASIGEGAQ